MSTFGSQLILIHFIWDSYITSDLHVICHSLKEYNAYRNFLEFEFMKLRKQQEDEVKERERKVSGFYYLGAYSVVKIRSLISTRVVFENKVGQAPWTKREKRIEKPSFFNKKRSCRESSFSWEGERGRRTSTKRRFLKKDGCSVKRMR